MPTPLRPPPGHKEEEQTPRYRHWTLEEFWGFRNEVVDYANSQIVEAARLEAGGSWAELDQAKKIRACLDPLLALIGKYEEKTRLT